MGELNTGELTTGELTTGELTMGEITMGVTILYALLPEGQKGRACAGTIQVDGPVRRLH